MFRNLQDKRPADLPQKKIWLAAAVMLLLAAIMIQGIGLVLSSNQDGGMGFQFYRNIEPGGNRGDTENNRLFLPNSLFGLAVCVTGTLVLGGSIIWLPEEQAEPRG